MDQLEKKLATFTFTSLSSYMNFKKSVNVA
jgi:hypothetical protein